MKRILTALSLLVCILCALPTHASLVGTTPGEFAVSPSGAATYTVPIELPPTVGGVKPSLALSYNSQAGNGIAGMGWGLSGLSSITRCPTTLAQDGFIDGVDFDSNDKFCLDGQRLVAVNGAYGADGTEYRTEIDSFSKIVGYGSVDNGPATFTVWTKAGEVMEYSIVHLSNSANSMTSWVMNKLSDSLGNNFVVSYQIENIEIGGNPQAIHFYSSSGQASPYSILFDYLPRADTVETYQSGKKANIKHRLSSIRINKENTQARAYKLNYEPGIQSVLRDIEKCEEGSQCSAPVELDYKQVTEGVVGWFSKKAYITPSSTGYPAGWEMTPGDVNGDGMTDMIIYYIGGKNGGTGIRLQALISDGNGGFDKKAYVIPAPTGYLTGWEMISGDVNGDGMTDMIAYYLGATNQGSGIRLQAFISDGNGGFSMKAYEMPVLTGYPKGWKVTPGDVNGDGMTDMIVYYIGGENGGSGVRLQALISDGNGGFTKKAYVTPANSGYLEGWKMTPGDVNGDGMTDMIIYYIGGKGGGEGVRLQALISDGNGGFEKKAYITPSQTGFTTGWEMTPGDVNGDGMTDMIVYYIGGPGAGSGIRIQALLSDGNGGFQNKAYVTPSSTGYPAGWSLIPGDANGDGMTDMIAYYIGGTGAGSGTRMQAFVSNGLGNFENKAYITPSSTGYPSGWRISPGDTNGDGVTDMTVYYIGGAGSGSGIRIQAHEGQGSSTVHLVKAYRKGSAAIDIKYAKLSGSNEIYTRTNRTYPERESQSPMQVVDYTQVDNGAGGYHTTRYKYEGLASDVFRRSSLGFKKITITQVDTNTVSTTEYLQDHPFIGMPKTKQTTVNGIIVSRSTTSSPISVPAYTGGTSSTPLFVYAPESTQYSYDYDNPTTDLENGYLSKTITQNNSFDDYGNPLQITVQTMGTGGALLNTTQTTNTYDNTEHNWHLGRLRTATVTHTPASGIAVTKSSAFAYDLTTGLLQTEIIEPNNPLHKLVTDYEYDQYGNRIKVTVSGHHKNYSANGTATLGAAFTRETNTEYLAGADHPAGLFPTKVTNAKGHFETRVYDPLYGNVKSSTGPNGIATTFEYDALGRKTKTIPAVGKASSTSYNWCTAGGNCPDSQGYFITKSVADVTGSATAYFDRYGRAVRNASTDRNNALIYTDTEYDNLGRVKRVSEPSYTPGDWSKFTQSHYDAAGRVDQIKRPDGLMAPKTIFNGLSTTTYDVKGRPTVTTKNALGQTIRIEDPANGSVNYSYDAVGNLTKTSTCEAGNNCVDADLEYDLRGNKIKMIDPDMGTWRYGYNTLGELTWQKDAKGQVTTMAYDALGRMIKRTGADGTVSEWVYDTAAGKGVGKLHKVLLNNAVFKQLSYDDLGRPLSTTTTIDGSYNYTTTSGYDNTFGRLDSVTYPAGFKLKYNYKNTGHLQSVTKFGDSSTAYWTAGSVCDNKPGALCTQFLGIRSTAVDGFDGIQVSSTYDNANPWLISQMANKVGDVFNPYQAFTYDYDNVGNLLSREQAGYAIGGSSDAKIERFDYDTYLDRVTGATTNGVVTGAYAYDGLGNITFKNDVGSYTYGAAASSCNADGFAGPHAVTQTTLNGVTTNYCYDANGNLVNGNGRTVTWNSFNKPLRMTQNGKWAEFSYGPNRSRYKKTSSDLATTHYAGMGGTGNVLYEKEFLNGSTTDYVARNHIYVGGKRIAVKLDYHNAPINAPEVVHYMLGDHLGSVTTIVNQDGNVVRRKSFDVWGKERNADTWSGAAAIDTDNHRGYTGHEAIQEVGLIHMNGRVYDAALARFVSADPHIQSAGNTQSYNRYSYVVNNPLKNVDPTGFIWKKIKKEARRFDRRVRAESSRAGRNLSDFANAAIAVALPGVVASVGGAGYGNYLGFRHGTKHSSIYRQGTAIAAGAADFVTGCVGCFSSAVASAQTAVLGGNLRDTLRSGAIAFTSAQLSHAIGHGIGDVPAVPEGMLRHMAHGVAQGGVSELRGGSFRSGFWAGGIGSGVPVGGIKGNGMMAIMGRTTAAAIVGGTASVLSGGKFANGARSAAFVRLFNHEWQSVLSVRMSGRAMMETVKSKVMGVFIRSTTGLAQDPSDPAQLYCDQLCSNIYTGVGVTTSVASLGTGSLALAVVSSTTTVLPMIANNDINHVRLASEGASYIPYVGNYVAVGNIAYDLAQ